MSAILELGRSGYLDGIIEMVFGIDLWSKQRQIVRSVSRPRSRTICPSCNSSGKTLTAAGLALAYYMAYPDAKVITTSAREDQLRDNMWGDIRFLHAHRKMEFPGNMPASGMRVTDGERLLTGLSPAEAEGIKGYHSPHVLIIIDEAAALTDEMAGAIMTLAASGDARILAILNPSDTSTWAYETTLNPSWNVMKIRAWDTPYFSSMPNRDIESRWGVHLEDDRKLYSEPIPPRASLITPDYLDDLVAGGKGPGTFDWQTSVEADFWAQGVDTLVPADWYDRARSPLVDTTKPTILGIDMASYGDSESVIAVRQGNSLIDLIAVSGYRIDHFWEEVVRPVVAKYSPQYVVYDADGPGAGSFTDADRVCGRAAFPFRGSYALSYGYNNMRSYNWWNLRTRFEWNDIHITLDDHTLRKQMTQITFQRREGKIRIEAKHDLRRRGIRNIDRADAVMYAFSTDPPTPPVDRVTEEQLSSRGNSERLMWERWNRRTRKKTSRARML